jgi:hypothetical protein
MSTILVGYTTGHANHADSEHGGSHFFFEWNTIVIFFFFFEKQHVPIYLVEDR